VVGFSVDPARDEETAVLIARSRKPDLHLVSVVGYGEDVVATARRLWQRAQLTEDVAVVMLGSPSVPEGAEVERAVNIQLHPAR